MSRRERKDHGLEAGKVDTPPLHSAALAETPEGRKVRLVDIAKAVGVSVTTVDRVLNERGGVRAETAERIERAIQDLGFVPNLAAKSLSRPKDLNFLFLVPGQTDSVTGYMMMLEEAVPVVARNYLDFRITATVRRSRPLDDVALAEAIEEAAETYDGIAMVALDTERVRRAVGKALAKGVRVVTTVSDLQMGGRAPYVGVDNYAAGRCVGYLMARFVGAQERPTIAQVAGSDSYRAHRHRALGFRDSILEYRPDVEVVTLEDVRNDGKKSFRIISDLLRQRDDIAGIYNVAAGNRGIIRALREIDTGMVKPVFIAHELTPHTRKGAVDGLVDAIVAQDPQLLVETAIRHLLQIGHHQDSAVERNISVPAVYFKENIF